MNNVRTYPRKVLQTEGWGNDVLKETTDAAKKELEEYLLSRGYRTVIYTSGHGICGGDLISDTDIMDKEPETIAYTLENVPFREELILIDDGGEIVCGLPVLKIAVRDAFTTNSHLDNQVMSILNNHGIADFKDGSYLPCADGTKVYALRRELKVGAISESEKNATPVTAIFQPYSGDFTTSAFEGGVSNIGDELRSNLLGGGYFPVVYDSNATAYTKEQVPFRQEPIVIDEGSFYLKITVRHATTCNKQLHDSVIELLRRYEIKDPTKILESNKGGPPDMRIYALHTA